MKYIGRHSKQAVETGKVGVLLLNLGTPEAPTKQALKRYLRVFLSDPRVVEAPRLIWQIILNIIILPFRPKRSARAYQQIWKEGGSPFLLYSEQQLQKLQAHYETMHPGQIQVELAMRYGEPSIESALSRFNHVGVEHLVVLPLYPQYSGTTTASMWDAVSTGLARYRWLPHIHFISRYFKHPAYIQALVQSIQEYQQEQGIPDILVFSYHGIPQRYVDAGDSYEDECHRTSQLVAEALGLTPKQYTVTFQSRFGKEPWLQPYTDATLKALPHQEKKHIQVICPGFSVDCLETLEEIKQENYQYFIENGGETFGYIPCLNATENHILALTRILESIEPLGALSKSKISS